jgi:Flp pilus assembly protein TadG
MKRHGWRPAVADDRGASSVEIAVLAPALLLIILLAIVAMRVEVAGEAVDASAHDAARAASISRNRTDAESSGKAAALRTLHADGLTCTSLTVNVDAHEFSRPIGEPASVTATVTCIVDLSDISIRGLRGTKRITSTFISPIDQYGGRS